MKKNYKEFDSGKTPEATPSAIAYSQSQISPSPVSGFKGDRNLDAYSHSTPDDIYGINSCTFIYDTDNGKLYIEKYPITHDVMLRNNDYEIAKAVGLKPRFPNRTWHPSRDDLMRSNVPNGRIGKLDGINAIGFWTEREIDEQTVNKIVREILKARSDIADSKIIVFSNYSYGFMPFVLNLADNTEKPEERDICDANDAININGEIFSLTSILSDLHMVRGKKLEKVKAGFCQQYEFLRRQLENLNCKNQLLILNKIKELIGCSNTPQDYKDLKQSGAANYRQDLQSLFRRGDQAAIDPNSTEDPVGTEFRGRQSDIDAAFDFLNRRENFAGFKEWLTKEVNNEKERRESIDFSPTSYKRNWR